MPKSITAGKYGHNYASNLDSSAYVPPDSRSTPLAGVTTALYCLRAKMLFNAPVNVAATKSGITYLQSQKVVSSRSVIE